MFLNNFFFQKVILGYYWKYAFIFVISSLDFTDCFSQRFNAGIIAGAVASQVSGDQLQGYDKSGFEIGGLVSIPLSSKVDASFQILFIQKGSKKNSHPEIGDYEYYRLKLNYIQVPLLFKYNFSKKVSLEAGTGIAVLLSAEEEDKYGPYTGKDFNKFEWTVSGGMNFMLFDNFFLVFGIENSVLPIRKFEPGEYRINRDQFNSLLRFSFRYIFKGNPATQ